MENYKITDLTYINSLFPEKKEDPVNPESDLVELLDDDPTCCVWQCICNCDFYRCRCDSWGKRNSRADTTKNLPEEKKIEYGDNKK